jgi:hypothetical protein
VLRSPSQGEGRGAYHPLSFDYTHDFGESLEAIRGAVTYLALLPGGSASAIIACVRPFHRFRSRPGVGRGGHAPTNAEVCAILLAAGS